MNVRNFLANNGLLISDVEEKFVEEQVRFEDLKTFGDDDLISIGLTSTELRVKILLALQNHISNGK